MPWRVLTRQLLAKTTGVGNTCNSLSVLLSPPVVRVDRTRPESGPQCLHHHFYRSGVGKQRCGLWVKRRSDSYVQVSCCSALQRGLRVRDHSGEADQGVSAPRCCCRLRRRVLIFFAPSRLSSLVVRDVALCEKKRDVRAHPVVFLRVCVPSSLSSL